MPLPSLRRPCFPPRPEKNWTTWGRTSWGGQTMRQLGQGLVANCLILSRFRRWKNSAKEEALRVSKEWRSFKKPRRFWLRSQRRPWNYLQKMSNSMLRWSDWRKSWQREGRNWRRRTSSWRRPMKTSPMTLPTPIWWGSTMLSPRSPASTLS